MAGRSPQPPGNRRRGLRAARRRRAHRTIGAGPPGWIVVKCRHCGGLSSSSSSSSPSSSSSSVHFISFHLSGWCRSVGCLCRSVGTPGAAGVLSLGGGCCRKRGGAAGGKADGILDRMSSQCEDSTTDARDGRDPSPDRRRGKRAGGLNGAVETAYCGVLSEASAWGFQLNLDRYLTYFRVRGIFE